MFTKILIANRGEIACRVAATAARMATAVTADVRRCGAPCGGASQHEGRLA